MKENARRHIAKTFWEVTSALRRWYAGETLTVRDREIFLRFQMGAKHGQG